MLIAILAPILVLWLAAGALLAAALPSRRS